MFIHHHSIVIAENHTPACFMLVLHGILGSGANWRTFARRLTEKRPDWGMVLVDLRQHGDSQGAPEPHTVDAAARDLDVLATILASYERPVRAVCGHSFGGKVALQYRALAGAELMQTWVIDASPSARPEAMNDPQNTVIQVLDMLDTLPRTFARRDDFIDQVEARGFARPLAQWLAMNLEHRDQNYVFRLDLASIRALLVDYYRLDSWPRLESGPGRVHVITAGKSSAVSQADREKLADMARQNPNVATTHIAGSGHWVHIEALSDLVDTIAADLPGC